MLGEHETKYQICDTTLLTNNTLFRNPDRRGGVGCDNVDLIYMFPGVTTSKDSKGYIYYGFASWVPVTISHYVYVIRSVFP